MRAGRPAALAARAGKVCRKAGAAAAAALRSPLLLLLMPASAAADTCAQLPLPAVTVKRLEEPLKMVTQYGYKALNQLGSALAQPGRQILGLTRANAVVQVAIKAPAYVDASGQWECASPQLTVTLGYIPMTVYVAKEFPAGSCAYNEIYQHEMRHVKTYQAHLASIENGIRELLERRFATGGPWRGPVGQTQARLQRELDERWLPYLQRELAHADAAQALIDTAEEYARVANTCNGEIRKRTL